MTWKFNEDTPIYLQIMEVIKVDIVNGNYQSGDKLKAVRDLATECGVNPNTVQRAYSELEREGLVQSERTSGRYVTITKEKIAELRDALSQRYIEDLFRHLKDIGMNEKQIKQAIAKWEDE